MRVKNIDVLQYTRQSPRGKNAAAISKPLVDEKLQITKYFFSFNIHWIFQDRNCHINVKEGHTYFMLHGTLPRAQHFGNHTIDDYTSHTI